MTIHKDKHFSIFFGDAKNCDVHHKAPEFKKFHQNLSDELGLENLVLNYQKHGTQGYYIDESTPLTERVMLYLNDGDFLITNKPKVGIGVLTADCLPVVIYDKKNDILGIAHAGWKGSVAGIAVKMIEMMLARAHFKPEDLTIYFGPSAHECCYEVQPDFIENLEKFAFKASLITQRDNKLFFNNSLLNKLQLIDLGIAPSQINLTYNLCTMCNQNFHSYRREKEGYICQATIAWIR